MFNNIIYFIVVLLIFSTNYPEDAPESSFHFSLAMLFLSWLVFAGYCRWGFLALNRRLGQVVEEEGVQAEKYQRMVVRLSILAILLFALAIYLFNFKYWIQLIPGFARFSVLQGILALALFFVFLSTIWYFACPTYNDLFRQRITRSSYIQSNIRFNVPVLFPWIFLSLIYDMIAFSPWAELGGFLNSIHGQLLFFAVFLTLLMIFMPGIIQYWWGCKPLTASEKTDELKVFLRKHAFKYRSLLRWPIFEGKILTAGIMGVVPRYRYILLTDSLLDVLSEEELKAVLAHEMGHAKYRHLIFYVLFFVGFMVLSYGLFDLFFYFFSTHPFFIKFLFDPSSKSVSLFYLMLSLPMLAVLLIYFRFIMGFFMRNFERQADLYSTSIMGTPKSTISALEKIALLSGKIRNMPSWHHFSIRERVDCLWRSLKDPGLIRRHNHFVFFCFAAYLICMGALGYFLNFSSVKQNLTYKMAEKALSRQLLKEPDNPAFHQSLALVYHQLGDNQKAIEAYEKVIAVNPEQAEALNNLAWIFVTASDETLRDEARGLELAKQAVSLERSPMFLDTLAEAYHVNGLSNEAVRTIKEALHVAKKDRRYYEKQLKKFLSSLEQTSKCNKMSISGFC